MRFFLFVIASVLLRLGAAFAPTPSLGVRSGPLRSLSSELKASSEGGDLTTIQELVGLTDAELKRIVSRFPELEGYAATVATDCANKLKARLSLSDLEFKKKVVLRLPQCLGYDYETDIGPYLKEVQSFLELSDDELKSLVLKCPQIIGLEFETEVRPKIEAVKETLGSETNVAALKEEILKKWVD